MKGFTPLQMNNSSNINYENASGRIVREKRSLSLTGFTLVEVLVSVLIFAFISAAIFMVLSVGKASWYTGDAEIELNQEMRKALMIINGQLRQSGSAVISGVPANDNYYTSITFKVSQGVGTSGSIQWSENINYSLNVNHQIISLKAGVSSILANNITSLQFRRPSGNPDIIESYITAQKNTAGGRSLQDSITSSVKMRN